MTINERVDLIIKVLFEGNKRAFANTVGISPTVVENIVGTRQGKPSYDVLVKICANANISAEWLLFGEETDKAMDMFTIRKDLEITAPYIDKNGKESEMKTFFKAGKNKQTMMQAHRIENPDLVEHLENKIKEKDKEIGNLHEDVGRLKERIAQLEREKNVSGVSYQSVPQRETVDSL